MMCDVVITMVSCPSADTARTGSLGDSKTIFWVCRVWGSCTQSALLLYNKLLGREFEVEDVVRVLTDEYEVNEADARKDGEAWVADMMKNGLVV